MAGNGIRHSVAGHVGHAEVAHCGGACLGGVHVLEHHLDRKADLGQVHDALHGHAGCTDDLGLEENVELRHFSVAREGAVSSALEGLHGIVGDFTCAGVVAVDGARGGDVVGEGSDLFGDRRRTAHDLSKVRDVPCVVITLSGRRCPVFLGIIATIVCTDGVFGVGFEGIVHHAFDGVGGHRSKGGYVQEYQNNSSNQHVSG